MHILKSKNHYYFIKIKDILDIQKLDSLIFMEFYYKKIDNIHIYIRIFTIKDNLVKYLTKKKLYWLLK